jgi:hypothetical protein
MWFSGWGKCFGKRSFGEETFYHKESSSLSKMCALAFFLFFFFFFLINVCFGVFTLQFMRHVACVSCTLLLSLGGSTEDLCHLLLWVMGLSIVCMNTLGLGH